MIKVKTVSSGNDSLVKEAAAGWRFIWPETSRLEKYDELESGEEFHGAINQARNWLAG